MSMNRVRNVQSVYNAVYSFIWNLRVDLFMVEGFMMF